MKLQSEYVDIYQYPTKIARLNEKADVVFGDLDGNAIKFLYFLIREGILDLQPADYQKLVSIYQTPIERLSKAAISEFHHVVSNAKISQPLPKIHMIGDDLADRGQNDLFTLFIYEKLNKEKADFEVLHSNHGAQFLKQYDIGLDNENMTLYRGAHHSFGLSLHNMQDLLDRELISLQEVTGLVDQHYLPRLKLLSYIVENDQLKILSHAPVDESRVKNLAALFGVTYTEASAQDMAAMLDRINNIFQILCQGPLDSSQPDRVKELARLCEVEYSGGSIMEIDQTIRKINAVMGAGIDVTQPGFLQQISVIPQIEVLLNDRYSDLKKTAASMTSHTGTVPPSFVTNIHGHVSTEAFPASAGLKWRYVNLDGNLGKGKINQETYIVLTSNHDYKSILTMEAAAARSSHSLQHSVSASLEKVGLLAHPHKPAAPQTTLIEAEKDKNNPSKNV
ncbi:hypothetical protein AQUSIP_02470 [Aquicella siphonis]|uniref:WipA-like phosphatase domain-containing protein n=1 Tax=Aquicella siphonis TaxID=254247 RepID=A0A5E4PEX0_9COXI|nr:hypothetical protein [Aquicella siphonis]VVC74973.1 hypothetical protein AQUSIP_02470 [Aquicella siphonis]